MKTLDLVSNVPPYTRMHRMALLLLLLLISAAMVSCKKDRLEGDAATLVGTWQWLHTEAVKNHCDDESGWLFEALENATADNQYALEFLAKGKVIFTHNEGVVWRNRLVIATVEELDGLPYDQRFVLLMNNRTEDPLELWINGDSLMLHDYPKDTDQPCEERFNYFVRR